MCTCIDLGCNFHQVITLPDVRNGNSDRYKFRVQLSCADSCHCVEIGSVTGPYRESILEEWEYLRNCHDMLCANAKISISFESKQFQLQDSQSAIEPTEIDYSCTIGSDC